MKSWLGSIDIPGGQKRLLKVIGSDLSSSDVNLHGSFKNIIEVENESVHDEISKMLVLLKRVVRGHFRSLPVI